MLTCYLSHVICYLSPVICHLSPVICYLSPVTCLLLSVTCLLLPVSCYLLPVSCYLPPWSGCSLDSLPQQIAICFDDSSHELEGRLLSLLSLPGMCEVFLQFALQHCRHQICISVSDCMPYVLKPFLLTLLSFCRSLYAQFFKQTFIGSPISSFVSKQSSISFYSITLSIINGYCWN